MSEINICGCKYTLSKCIGEGLTAKVYKVVHQQKMYALKMVDKGFYRQSRGKALIDNEIDVLNKMKH